MCNCNKIGLWFDKELFSAEAITNTPRRIEEMLREFKEYREWDELEKGKGIFKIEGYNDLVVMTDIDTISFCEHHCMPMIGVTHVACLPNGYVVGLSKIIRTVWKFAMRPQLQERMTKQIADYLYEHIPKVMGVMVIQEMTHYCYKWRGIKTNARTVTSAIRGEIPKEEVLELLKVRRR